MMAATKLKLLDGIERGDKVTIHDGHGSLLHTGVCIKVLATQAIIKIHTWSAREAFLLSSGKKVGGTELARPATAEQIAEAEAELQRREDEKQAAEAAKRQAAYDALPEAIKLARSLRWMCDCASEKAISEAPIEHLRGIVEWAKARKLETE